MTRVLETRKPARLSLERLLEQAGSAVARPASLDLHTPIDGTLPFVCPALTPLYYTDSYRELTPAQALRYNQLMGLAFTEVIRYFEEVFGGKVLPALLRASALGGPLRACVEGFLREEEKHADMWRALNGLCEPERRAHGSYRFAGISPAGRRALAVLARRPEWFPFVFWVMLAEEELSMEVARRCAEAGPERIEPRFALAYRLHLADEVRHVQLDWYLIERFYEPRSPAVRKMNAAVLRFLFREFLLSPRRLAVRVIKALADEWPELVLRVPRLARELRRLRWNRDYQATMYSRRSHPITFHLFDRYPEMHRMAEVFFAYSPCEDGGQE